jgi:hypothetical protein
VKLLTDLGFIWEASRRRLLDGGFAVADTGMDNNDLNKGPVGGSSSISRKKCKILSTEKRKRAPPEPHDDDGRHEVPEFLPELPGLVGVDLAASMGPTAMFAPQTSGASSPPAFSAPGQFGVMQGNLGGLWAALAAGQGGYVHQPLQLPFLVQTATGPSMNPALLIPMGAALMQLGVAMQGAPGMPYNPSQLAAALLQAGMTQQNPQYNHFLGNGMQQFPQPQGTMPGMTMSQNVQQMQNMATGMQQISQQEVMSDELQRNQLQGAVTATLLPQQGMSAGFRLSNQQQPSHAAVPQGGGQADEAPSESPNYAGDGGDHTVPFQI